MSIYIKRLISQIVVVTGFLTLLFYSPTIHSTIRTRVPSLSSPLSWKSPSTNDLTHLQSLCATTDWTDGLWLHCHSHGGEKKQAIRGGLNNARNRLQTCLRMAIDSGAGLILSTVMTRNETNLAMTNQDEYCTDFYWDIERLQTEIGTRCPQLNLRRCGNTTGLDIKLQAPKRNWVDANYALGEFRSMTDAFLAKSNVDKKNISSATPVVIEFGDSYMGWNYTRANETSTIKAELFKTLTYNPDLLRIGAKVFDTLESLHPIVAVHYRGEEDWPTVFGSRPDQRKHYTLALDELRNTTAGIKNVYVSCGDRAQIESFRKYLEPLNYTVYDKLSLLESQPSLLEQVENLAFDQKAIVEYTTLTRAEHFFGVLPSSYSALIAYDRTVDDNVDFWDEYVNWNSTRGGFITRNWDRTQMRGTNKTKMMVVTGPDILDCYP
jgi:hypothetical protein